MLYGCAQKNIHKFFLTLYFKQFFLHNLESFTQSCACTLANFRNYDVEQGLQLKRVFSNRDTSEMEKSMNMQTMFVQRVSCLGKICENFMVFPLETVYCGIKKNIFWAFMPFYCCTFHCNFSFFGSFNFFLQFVWQFTQLCQVKKNQAHIVFV